MAQDKHDTSKTTPPKAITVDWIVITVSLIGITIVLAASLQAGEGSLVSTLTTIF